MVKRSIFHGIDDSQNSQSSNNGSSQSDFGIETNQSLSNTQSYLLTSSESDNKKYRIFEEESDDRSKIKLPSITSENENEDSVEVERQKQRDQGIIYEENYVRPQPNEQNNESQITHKKGKTKKVIKREKNEESFKEDKADERQLYNQLQKMYREQIQNRKLDWLQKAQNYENLQQNRRQLYIKGDQLQEDSKNQIEERNDQKMRGYQKRRKIAKSMAILMGKNELPSMEKERQAKKAGVRIQQVRFEGDWICPKEGCPRIYTIKSNLISHIRKDHPIKCGKIIKKIVIPKKLEKINVLTKKYVDFCLYDGKK